jgi:hydroxypyruvate reductase
MAGERVFLRGLFDTAVAAVTAETCLPPHLPQPPAGRTVVVGFGKAAAAMAASVERHWPGPLSGVVVTRDGHGDPGARRIRVIEAGHPLPDDRCLEAAAAVEAAVAGLSADDLVIALASGGGSSLLVHPAPGIALAEKRAISAALLRSGAAIGEINTVRRHLSAIKGGRLALACRPARVVTLVISDVPGDDPSVVAAGPTVPGRTTPAQAGTILADYAIQISDGVARWLADPAAATPGPDDPAFAHVETRVVATAQTALRAAARAAREAGIEALVLGDDLEGEAKVVAGLHASIARELARARAAGGPPRVILSGGETSVTLSGPGGRGGRNAEFLLALALALDGQAGIHALAADTDGIDGTEDNAGARIDATTLARARRLGLDPAARLAAHDSYGLFAALGDLVVTGPTRTNVNDFRAILVD